MSEGWAEARATADAPIAPLSPEIRDALMSFLAEDENGEYERDALHYGADLWPGTCERKTWYRLHGTTPDTPRLADRIRFFGGRAFENLLGRALAKKGLVEGEQVLVKPRRPSAWAWSEGHADLLLVGGKLVEVKAPRAELFAAAKNDPRRLVKEQYRWQLSAYFHELERRGLAKTAAFVFLDREGSNDPVEVPLDEKLLVPLSEIVEQEKRKSRLLDAKEPPIRVSGTFEIRVWKGGRKTKVNPNPERRVEGFERRNWQCNFCPFVGTCQPLAEDQALKEILPADRARALEAAESAWAQGHKGTPFVFRPGEASELLPDPASEDERDQEIQPDEASSTGTAADPETNAITRESSGEAAETTIDPRPTPGPTPEKIDSDSRGSLSTELGTEAVEW